MNAKVMVSVAAAIVGMAGLTWAAEVTVFAAASLSESLQAIVRVYEKQTGTRISVNFAASGILARQIEAGAPADIFISADEASADALEKKGLLVKASRKDRLSNGLVVVVPVDSQLICTHVQDLADPGFRRIAMGNPQTVPVGRYAKIYLEKKNLWAALEGRMIPGENVKAVLAFVESGNVEAGIIYKTDAAISKKVRVAFEVPQAEVAPIRYPMALVTGSKEPRAAQRFLDYLSSREADAVFRKFGFIVLE